jgi:hypothetical protein
MFIIQLIHYTNIARFYLFKADKYSAGMHYILIEYGLQWIPQVLELAIFY